MSKKRVFFILLALSVVIGLIGVARVLILGSQKPALAALRVDSVPLKTRVFLNDREIGLTPYYDEQLAAGEYRVKLIPPSSALPLRLSWETDIRLTGGTLTYISRDLGTIDEETAGQVLTLEKTASDKKTELVVVSTPDGATVLVDKIDRGRAPLMLTDIQPGNHIINISSPAYADQIVNSRIIPGFRLNIAVKLRRLPSLVRETIRPTADLIATSSGQAITKPYVLISETPLGFLRVRTLPDFTASESGKVLPGEKYPLLSESQGWVKIKQEGTEGWVSGQYVEIFK